MAAFVLSPERWRELSASTSSPAGDQAKQQTPQAGPALRRRISRVFYESHTPVSSPVAINMHHLPAAGDDEELAGAGVMAVERFLPQRRSPGQRSQDSGFSGYSGDSASEGSAPSSSNTSPVPAAATAAGVASTSKRSPLGDPEAAGRALAEPAKVLETDLDATPCRAHVSRVYIGPSSSSNSAANLNLRDVLCEKNIESVNLSGSESSPDKCVGDKSLIGAVLASSATNRNNVDADRSSDSQTALLLEHKSIVPPSSVRPNLSWKKLSESFRRVISSGRMMTASTATPPPEGDESFTDEEKSRMLLLGKRSNLRRTRPENEEETKPESPQPTCRYLGGPRSSTPRKTLPAGDARNRRAALVNNNNNNNNKQCSRFVEERPRVHWADADPNRRERPQSRLVASSWPDNSTWDADTPSLEIGQQVVVLPAAPERKIRRGLRMGVGVDRSLISTRKPLLANQFVQPAPVQQLAPPTALLQQPPYGLRWSPVEAWLKDLPMFYQPESTCALQNKAIVQHDQRRTSAGSWTTDDSSADGSQQLLLHQSDDEERTYSATVTARAQVRRLQRRAHLISTEFAQLCSFIELYEEAKLTCLIPLFLAHVIQFIREAEAAVLPSDSAGSEQLIDTLRHTCAQLVQLVSYSTHLVMTEPDSEAGPPTVNWSLARQITAKLGQVFVSIVDTFVGREIQVLTAALKSGKCISAAKLAANSLMSLGSDAARPALGPLIEAFQVVHLRPVRADLLRALSALCSSADIIQEFESCGGLTVVFEVLCNPRSEADLEEKSEAAGLLAQITSPWLDPPVDAQQVDGGVGEAQVSMPASSWPTLHLTPFISSFIAALTDLSGQTETEETLLLSTAALANLTFSHAEAVQLMAKYRTAQVLVEACGVRKQLSVFVQDQIATILANMAAVYSARADLVSNGALALLVSFLQLRPSPLQRPAEVTASERVLKKSAIALSRVCGEENAARQIVELQGIERLAQLVREPRERNYSDGVLVACLAALHKIATACGTDELDRHGATDLIENRLLDVFLEYSSRPESYV